MRFTLTIDCDNAAFGDDIPEEVCRLLAEVIRSDNWGEGILRDSNGNTVGRFGFEEGN